MKTNKVMKITGIAGIIGGILAVGADIASGYSTTPNLMNTALSLSLENVAGLLVDKPHWQLVLGHYLALVAIPLEGLGILLHTTLAFKPARKPLSWVFLLGGGYLFALGTAYHGTYGFIAEIVKRGDPQLTALAADYFEPFGVGLSMLLLLFVVYWAVLILRGLTNYPRMMVFASPLSVMLVSTLLVTILPHDWTGLRTFITVTGLNLPLLIWITTSTIVMWQRDFDVALSTR